MDDGGPTASIILFLVLILIDVMLFGFSAAIQQLSYNEIEKNEDETFYKKRKKILFFMDNTSWFIGTLQLVVTLINFLMGGYFFKCLNSEITYLMMSFFSGENSLNFFSQTVLDCFAFFMAGFVILYAILTFGILIPKRLGARYPEKWVFTFIYPVLWLTYLTRPLNALVNLSSKGFLRIFGIKVDHDNDDVTEEEIISMVNEGHEQGVLLAREAEMITNIFEYGDLEAQDIMTHRKNIVSIDRDSLLEDAINVMLEGCNSRYPVYDENIDHIVGVLNLKDALRIKRKEMISGVPIKDIKNLLRKVEFIPETRKINTLLQTMQAKKIQLVIVVDEYGQTSGLITMEDILEEIVGNIMDEYDIEEGHIKENSDSEFVIEGMTHLEELEERFEIDFKEDDFETINGFLISKMDKIPESDEEFEIDVDGYNFKVLSVENKMIHSVLVTKKLPEENEEENS